MLGGERNYDYRYVWMRDISLVVDALTQLDTKGKLEPRFLDFVARAYTGCGETKLEPVYTVDGAKVHGLTKLSLGGYQASRPVQIGNEASDQLQLDAHANALSAAKQVYDVTARSSNGRPWRRGQIFWQPTGKKTTTGSGRKK